ncbi:von Willebrand factor, type A [Candidatus Sulfopaludibacter sp. SbA3]|nr:von Willebrand factor, type A [Candidatus Sulfopaludibacter sp. SbA3]
MLHRNKRILAIPSLLALSLAALAVHAQQQAKKSASQTPEDVGQVFKVDTRQVVCNTTVVDRNGHLVTDLKQSAFTVTENGAPQSISVFKREDVPVSLGLVIDNSGSMRDKRAKVAAAALALVKDSNKDDEVFVVNFNDDAFLDLPGNKDFTSDINEMEEALSRIDSRGGTAMRDAIRMSIEHLRDKAHKTKKVLVVVTDGNDNSSVINLENLVKGAQQSEVLIYAVGLLSDEEKREAARAKKDLSVLTETTGGEPFFPKDIAEVDRIAHQVAHDIRSQYTIAYSPSNAAMDGSYRKIQISVNAPGKLQVRTRSGYYATPDAVNPPKGSNSLINH